MASTRTNERLRYRYGICLNDNCEKCKSKEVQEIPTRKDFVCQNPECGKPLRECPPPKKGGGKKLLGIILCLVALVAIISIVIFTGGSPKVEKLSLDKMSVMLKPGQTEKLNVIVEPAEVTPSLMWQSSDDAVVSVHDGVITAKKPGKATVTVLTIDPKEISAVCECVVTEDAIDIETMDIQEEPVYLRPGGHQQLTILFTPENQNENIVWTSTDVTVATVTHKGKVEAVKVGRAQIIATSDRTGISDTATVYVEGSLEKLEELKAENKTPAPQPSKPTAPVSASKSKNLGYATFKGSWPNDVNGRMVFTSSHVIDSKDPKGRVAEAGDYVIGEWSEGHLVQGIWYGADNVVKGSIIIGK